MNDEWRRKAAHRAARCLGVRRPVAAFSAWATCRPSSAAFSGALDNLRLTLRSSLRVEKADASGIHRRQVACIKSCDRSQHSRALRAFSFARFVILTLVILLSLGLSHSSFATGGFTDGTTALRNGDYATAAEIFSAAAVQEPSAGAFQNLGLAEWQRGRRGQAVLAWERALWVDPFNESSRENLRFARKVAQIEAPQLAWYEVASTWLPVNAWAWLAGASLWVAIGIVMLPPIFRWQRRGWHQAVAALGLAVFLVCIPAMFGVNTRARIGFVLEKNTQLRLTPTRDAQTVTMLGAGEPARIERARGNFLLIRTTFGRGWIGREQFGRVCPE